MDALFGTVFAKIGTVDFEAAGYKFVKRKRRALEIFFCMNIRTAEKIQQENRHAKSPW